MQIRKNQLLLNDAIAIALFKHRSIIAQAPTGMGKTVCIAFLADRFLTKFPQATIFICVHRFELVAQTVKKLNALGLDSFQIVAGTKHVPPGQNIYVCMVETLANRMDKIGFQPDLLILDEAHIGNHFKIIDAYKDKSLVLGFSATPVSKKKDPLKKYFREIVLGPEVKDLIDQGFLCNPLTFNRATDIDKKKLKVSAGDYSEASQYAMLSTKKQMMNTFAAYQSLAPGKKTVIFNCNVAHNNDVTGYFNDHGVPARSVDGTTPSDERAEIFSWFESTPGAVLCNIGVATTGFDEPSVECIILNFITKSLAKYIQCIGRGSRTHPGKDHFRIIDLGDNWMTFGLWEYPQDWYDIFHNPGRPGKGVAPTKMCTNEECGNIIHLSVTVCPYCGEEMPRENNYDDKQADFSCIGNYKGPLINIERAIHIAQEHGHNSWAPLMKTVESAVAEARKITDTMTPEFEKKIRESVYGSAEIFYKSIGKTFKGNQKGFVNKLVSQRIQTSFS